MFIGIDGGPPTTSLFSSLDAGFSIAVSRSLLSGEVACGKIGSSSKVADSGAFLEILDEAFTMNIDRYPPLPEFSIFCFFGILVSSFVDVADKLAARGAFTTTSGNLDEISLTLFLTLAVTAFNVFLNECPADSIFLAVPATFLELSSKSILLALNSFPSRLSASLELHSLPTSEICLLLESISECCSLTFSSDSSSSDSSSESMRSIGELFPVGLGLGGGAFQLSSSDSSSEVSGSKRGCFFQLLSLSVTNFSLA